MNIPISKTPLQMCSICGNPIELELCIVDEDGRGVHADCYTSRLADRLAPLNDSPKIKNRGHDSADKEPQPPQLFETNILDYPSGMSEYEKESQAAEAKLAAEKRVGLPLSKGGMNQGA